MGKDPLVSNVGVLIGSLLRSAATARTTIRTVERYGKSLAGTATLPTPGAELNAPVDHCVPVSVSIAHS